jgi:hypothetical protein
VVSRLAGCADDMGLAKDDGALRRPRGWLTPPV